MPMSSLVQLAREAQQTNVTLVIAGFDGEGVDVKYTQQRIAQIDEACCHSKVVQWMIHPVLFRQYNINSVPALVIAKGNDADINNYSKVSGDIGLRNSLKAIYQNTKNPELKVQAKKIYENSLH